jgi:ATP-binding cassette subfamily B (MDR/TAP) protein 1
MNVVMRNLMILALVAFVGYWSRTYFLMKLGENVTEEVKKLLYGKILEKDMGWFDDRDHATSVLTTRMAEDCSRLNDVAGNSVQPVLTGFSNLLAGFIIAMIFCW